jgi:hypothetical protein
MHAIKLNLEISRQIHIFAAAKELMAYEAGILNRAQE